VTGRTAASTFRELGTAVLTVDDVAARDALVDTLATPSAPQVVGFVNAHACNLAVGDSTLRDDLLAADVLLRDGSGLQVLCRRLGREAGLNMNGTDLIPALLDRFAGRPVALLGTRDPWLANAATRVAERSPVVATHDGFAGDDVYVELLQGHPADLVVLGMGMPRQEALATRLRESISHPCTIVCGGAILDFLGERVQRAPAPFRRLGIEWVWRLALEPRRLFRRYVIGNVEFLARTLTVRRTG
jgi:exopolysaccharide biosynthesis WecB/TagA/CpsF family protein